jgi:hypothetical protein
VIEQLHMGKTTTDNFSPISLKRFTKLNCWTNEPPATNVLKNLFWRNHYYRTDATAEIYFLLILYS